MKELEIHPRVAQQGIDEECATSIVAEVRPRLVPFQNRQIDSVIALLDWDHRLPSRGFTLRVHVCYKEATRRRLGRAFERRCEEIAKRNLCPEFDVPDFGGFDADESYDVELSPSFHIENIRLTSPWRREIADQDAEHAIAAVRASKCLAELLECDDFRVPDLAELEAIAWTPPCESGAAIWMIEVWWLKSFDGRCGRARSFLVALHPELKVLSSREFTIRTE
jgi:hypothetical protein